jgi:plastocyanin
MPNRRRLALAGLVVLATACGSKAPAAPTPAVPTTTITITATGVNPKNIEIALGQRVLFVNGDTRAHNMGSDPHPDHTDCPVINQVGLLQPGQSRETGNFVQARSCGYHDHDMPTAQNLQGAIITK